MEDPIAPAAAGAPSKPVFITEAPAAGAPAIPQADDFSKDEIVEMTAGAREEPSETMRLMDKRKRQQEAQRSLEEERKKFAERMEALEKRSEALSRKTKECEKNMKEYSAIIKNNEEKRKADAERAEREKQLRERVEQDIDRKTAELTKLMDEQKRLAAECDRLQCYKAFLESVDETGTIEGIMSRYNTLLNTNAALRAQVEELRQGKEATVAAHSELVKEKQNAILMRQSQLDQLQFQLKSLRLECNTIDQNLSAKQDMLKEQKELYAQIAMAIRNLQALYYRMSASDKKGPDGRSKDRKPTRTLSEILQDLRLKIQMLQYVTSGQPDPTLESDADARAAVHSPVPAAMGAGVLAVGAVIGAAAGAAGAGAAMPGAGTAGNGAVGGLGASASTASLGGLASARSVGSSSLPTPGRPPLPPSASMSGGPSAAAEEGEN